MHKFLGVNDRGLACYASDALIAQKGIEEVKENMGLVRRYPVKVDLSGTVVMVAGGSHEDAVRRYLNSRIK